MEPSLSEIKMFISYAREESTNEFVLKLKEDLESVGLKVFLDKDNILPSDNIRHELAEGIKEAHGIIIVHSKRYSESKWCNEEYQMALRKNKQVFPILRTKDQYQPKEDMAFGSTCWVDFTDNSENGYQQSLDSLIKGIRKK